MSTGADNKTMPVTAEYENGYERIFGKREPVRGRWIQHPQTGELIHESEYVAPQSERALDAPVMVDRFYEGVTIDTVDEKGKPTKVDVGSRKRHRDFLKSRGLTTADDFTETWKKAEQERARMREGIFPDAKERREEIGRIAYEVEKKNARRGR